MNRILGIKKNPDFKGRTGLWYSKESYQKTSAISI